VLPVGVVGDWCAGHVRRRAFSGAVRLRAPRLTRRRTPPVAVG
jgi:hypothetical protein